MTLALDARTTALVVIDLQKGIASMPVAPHSGPEVIERASALARALRAKGGVVVQVRVGWSADFGDSLAQPCDAPTRRGPGLLPDDWLDFADRLSVEASDLQVVKRQWGAVYGTELDLQLRRRGVRTVVMTGISTNFGVESTARELWERGYALVFAEDAMAGPTAEAHCFATGTIFPRIGRVRSTDAILAAIG
jgi:nicotinamidase-related amidase